MKTILTATILLAPLMAFAAPAKNAGVIHQEPRVSHADRDVDRGNDARDRDRSPDYSRKDDRRDDTFDNRRPAPAPAMRREHIDRAINSIYREVLLRDADAPGLRKYRDRMMKEGWTESHVRAALRDSSEFRGTVVNTIIARAYRDILGRAPDASGLENYRYKIIARGMTEEGLRRTLIDSTEYRNRLVMIAANDARNTHPGSRNDGRRLR